MTPFLYAVITSTATLVGGSLPLYTRLRLVEQRYLVAFAGGEAECETHVMGWPALIGIAAESLIDGLAIAVGFRLAPALGLLIALAVFVHEVPRGLTTAVIMQEAGYSRIKTWVALLVDTGFALVAVLVIKVSGSTEGILWRMNRLSRHALRLYPMS